MIEVIEFCVLSALDWECCLMRSDGGGIYGYICRTVRRPSSLRLL